LLLNLKALSNEELQMNNNNNNNKNLVVEDKIYFRANEVADFLSIGKSTVWLYASQGRLKPKKISSRVTVFHIDDIRSLFDD